MPTIEIVSLGCKRLLPIKNSTFPFLVLQNTKLVSHRGLFQNELDKQTGTILHLGNKDMGRTGYFFGNELIDWDAVDEKNDSITDDDKKRITGELKVFAFAPLMFEPVIKLLNLAIKYSPISTCFFYTDIQNGSEPGLMNGIITLDDFVNKQYREYYIFNTLYEIKG